MDELDDPRPAEAQIVDVRTPGEYEQGHLPGSLNIPLDQLLGRLDEIDPARPVLLCCASGVRSAMAQQALASRGYTLARNAGPWTRLQ